MLKSSIFIVYLLFVVIKCASVNQDEQKEVEFTKGYSLDHNITEINQKQSDANQEQGPEPMSIIYPLVQSSSTVNNDGSFSFVSQGKGTLIEINGILIKGNGTLTLELKGSYKFNNIFWLFVADANGFMLGKPLPSKVVRTVLG